MGVAWCRPGLLWNKPAQAQPLANDDLQHKSSATFAVSPGAHLILPGPSNTHTPAVTGARRCALNFPIVVGIVFYKHLHAFTFHLSVDPGIARLHSGACSLLYLAARWGVDSGLWWVTCRVYLFTVRYPLSYDHWFTANRMRGPLVAQLLLIKLADY